MGSGELVRVLHGACHEFMNSKSMTIAIFPAFDSTAHCFGVLWRDG